MFKKTVSPMFKNSAKAAQTIKQQSKIDGFCY